MEILTSSSTAEDTPSSPSISSSWPPHHNLHVAPQISSSSYSAASCEISPSVQQDDNVVLEESSNLLLQPKSHEYILTSSPVPVRASSCMKCKGGGVPLSKSSIDTTYYNNHEQIVQIYRNLQMPAQSSASPHARQRSSLDEVVTCANCIQRGHGGGKGGGGGAGERASRWFSSCCGCREYWGILLSLCNGLASTFGGLIVRYKDDFHPFSLAAYKFQGILLPALLIILYYYFVHKRNVFDSIWPLKDKDKLMKFGFTIIRAVIGCLGLFLFYYAVKLIPLADVKAIMSCRTVFVIFVAHMFLGEPCGIFPVFVAMLSVIGVGIISRPPMLTGAESFDTDKLMGVMFSTLAMLTVTLSLVVLRYLRGVHVSVVTLAFGFWGTILSLGCSATVERFDVPETTKDWILMFCLALAAFFSQTAIALAMKYEHAGAVVIVSTCDTIMSFGLQYFILGDKPDLYSIVGAGIIVGCVTLITLRKWVRTLPEKHSRRQAFWFVLR